MANYDIPDYPLKRVRYFNNQFLIDQDFIDSEVVQIGHERAILRALCVAGVCEGLLVTYPATNKPPSVGPGVAVDAKGRMIVVASATDALARPDALADGDYFVHISFLETEDDKATGQGAPDFTRWKQTPVINATAKSAALPDGAVVLGSCTVQNKVFVGTATTAGRQYSGLRLPGANPTVTATLRNTGAADDLAVLGCSLTLRRDAAAKIGPTLTLLNGPGSAGAGGAIDFNGYDPGGNAPSARVQSLDDGNSSSHLAFATKQPGAATNGLVERLRLTSDGLLRFPNEAVKDKLVLWDNGAADRYGLGLNGTNINLFCPLGGRFSLRQNGSTGAEVFTVAGNGNGTFTGTLAVAGAATVTGALAVGGTLRVSGTITAAGTRISNANGFNIVETNANDWLRINPDQQFPGIALFKAVGIGTGGLSVGDFTQLPTGQLKVTSNATVGGTLRVSGTITAAGTRISNANGFGIVETNATDWLRVNPDQQFPGIALFKPVAIGTGGLSVGDWSQLPTGQLKVTSTSTLAGGALIGAIGIGGGNFNGAVSFPYETIQMNPANNLRIWYGTTEQFVFWNAGIFQSSALRGSPANWNAVGADGTVMVDNVTYKSMMIVGSNQGQGHARWVRMWDEVQVESHLTVNGKIGAAGQSPTGGGSFPAGWFGGVHTYDIVVEATVGYNNITKFSSIHTKTDITELPDALATLEQLRPVIYDRTGESHAGLVAEEVREVFSHGSDAGSDAFFAVGIRPDSLLALTIAAVQELSARVRKLSRNDRGEPVRAPAAARDVAAATAQPDAISKIEILREGTKDSVHYVTARFHSSFSGGESRRVVRTIRIPNGASREQCLEAEYEAWHRRIAERA